MKKFKSKPRTPAYVEEVYHRIEVEMCTARNAVVALDLRIGHIVAKLPPEDQAEVEAALKDYNVTVCTAISKAGGLLAALDPRDKQTLLWMGMGMAAVRKNDRSVQRNQDGVA